MEHIVQFGISIDDNAIINAVQKKAEEEIIKRIKAEVEHSLFGDRYYYSRSSDPHEGCNKPRWWGNGEPLYDEWDFED